MDRAGDCNDEPGENGAEQFPEATEFCDEVDNNCNGLIDEELGAEDYYVDADHDGYGGSENTRVRSCQDPGDGWSLTYGDCNDSDKSVWSNCDGNDPGPLVGALAPESLPDGKWRVGVRFFDRFGVDWENATLQVAGAGGDGSLAHAPEFLTTVVDAPDGATITLSGQVSSVQAAVRSYSFTQTLLALEIDTYSEAFEDVESVTVANWERASSRGRPGYSRSIGGSTQHSSLEGGELPYDFFYRNRSLGVSQSDTGLESSVLEFSSGGRGGLTFELRRTYSSATVYTNEVRPEINTIVTPMLSSLVSDVDCGPNGDQPCPAVDAAIRNAESRMVDFLVKGAEDSCVRLRDRWVGMMKLGGQRGWFGDPIPDNVEDLDCKFQRVVRGIASEFRAGTIDFDTVLRRLSPSSPEVLSHNEVMPFWPKSDRAQGRETVYCHPGIPGFDAYQRCQGADPNTYVAELAPERDEKRVLVRARSIEFALPGPLGHGTNAQLAASLRGDSMTIGREQPILADVPCSVAMAEQKELYDDFRPRFECLGWKTPYATFASVAARIVPL
ncbi:MAG: putative metal-binding motif-containing protein, partial [Myxococcota bacterium]